MAPALLNQQPEVMLMDALIVSATFAGSLGTAWIIQRAILTMCLKAIAPNPVTSVPQSIPNTLMRSKFTADNMSIETQGLTVGQLQPVVKAQEFTR